MGNPVSHSLSPQIHQQFAQQFGHDIVYEKIQIQPATFSKQVHHFFETNGSGLNITLPVKKDAYLLCQQTSSEAVRQSEAVNTLWSVDNTIRGANTDGYGLVRDLSRFITLKNKTVVILGAGGACAGVLPALFEAAPQSVTVANRTMARAQDLKLRFKNLDTCSLESLEGGYDVIIHATSLGLNGGRMPLTSSLWSEKPFCYDLSYSLKDDTPFVKEAKKNHCSAVDGLGMLVEQASKSYEIWQGVMPETMPVIESLKKGLNR